MSTIHSRAYWRLHESIPTGTTAIESKRSISNRSLQQPKDNLINQPVTQAMRHNHGSSVLLERGNNKGGAGRHFAEKKLYSSLKESK